MRKTLVPALALSSLLIGCSSTMQTASINEAYKYFERENYKKTLTLITQASSAGELTRAKQAELTYLKALSYERMGYKEQAVTLFTYLREQHPDSQYAYLSTVQSDQTPR